jgi:hypothetical protein
MLLGTRGKEGFFSAFQDIFLKQKAALRTICEAKYNAHTKPLFKSNGILPLGDLILYFNMLFMFDNNLNLPVTFQNCGEEIFLLKMQIMLWLCATVMIFTFLCAD